MRQPLANNARARQVSTVVALPAPIGGWNTASSLASMPPLDAITMDNFIPEEKGVVLRGGDSLFSENMSGDVETLVEYTAPGGNELLAASDGNIYDITSGGSSPTSLGSGFTNALWQTANYNSHMFFANGADTVQDYNGTTLANSTFTFAASAPAGGLADLINVNVVRDRLWFVEDATGHAWYGPLAGVTGNLTLFDIGEISRSGFLMQVASWSRDSGDGMDDLTVFIMSTGQCIVYQGDPASTFSRVGAFDAPKPIARRCTINLGGELIIITRGGYFTLSDIMAGQVRPQDALSAKIRTAVSDAVEVGGSFDGWGITLTPDQRKLIVNYPTVDGATFEQHVFSTITKGWGRWQQRNTFAIGTLNDDLYGGFTGGEVYKLETGKVDASRSDANIEGYCIQAFNSFEDITSRNKYVTMIKPFVRGTGDIPVTVRVWADYETAVPDANLQSLNPGGLAWELYNVVNWEDWALPWGSDDGGVSTVNLSANVRGDTFAPSILVNTAESVTWQDTNLTIQPGGIT